MGKIVNSYDKVADITTNILYKINSVSNESFQKAILANLRNSINKPLGENIESLAFVLENIPDEIIGWGKELSNEEKSIITSLQLFALHQQGLSESVLIKDKEDKWQNMGYALGSLREVEDPKSIDRRFNAMITASSFEEFTYYLRQMVKLLKSKTKGSVKVNYSRLSWDLYRFLIGYQNEVRLDWARKYYSFKKLEMDDKGDINEEK